MYRDDDDDDNLLHEEQLPEDLPEEEEEEEIEEEIIEEHIPSEIDLSDKIQCMKFLKDDFLQKTYKVYKPSTETLQLLSERNRQIFAETFKIEEDKKPKKFEDEEKQQYVVSTLFEICVNFIMKRYKGGNLDERIKGDLRERFGELIDLNFPLEDVIDLDNDTYWKRVFKANCNDVFLIGRTGSTTHKRDWKSLGIQEKFQKIIETTEYEDWDEEEKGKLADKVAPYVKKLRIRQLRPLREYSIEVDESIRSYRVYNYPSEICHHVNLDIIGKLKDLTSFHIEFQPPCVGYKYEDRYFLFSLLDIKNLARGLEHLKSLEEFILRRSKMDSDKLRALTLILSHLPLLEKLDLSYCDLNDDCGWILAEFLEETSSIKTLILDGNHLSGLGISSLFFGVLNYSGLLDHISLERNIIGNDGVMFIGRSLSNSDQVKHLNLNGCLIDSEGTKIIAEYLKFCKSLEHLKICAIPFGKSNGKRLIENLIDNQTILNIECRGCDLTVSQEAKIKMLLKRNSYMQSMPFRIEGVEVKTEERKALNEELDKWLKAVKNPILLRVQKSIEKENECKENTFEMEPLPVNIPKIIPHYSCVERTNKTLLHSQYYDTPDDEPKMTINMKRKSFYEEFVFDPNNFTKEEVSKQIDIGSATVKGTEAYFRKAGASKRQTVRELISQLETLDRRSIRLDIPSDDDV